MPRGLHKATGGVRKWAEVQPGEKCVIHPDRDATHTVTDASLVAKPVCTHCAEYGTAHGYVVWPPIEARQTA